MTAGRPPRVVSLVPSLTEAVAVSAPGALVGATDWCAHPADLDVVRVRGTKTPDVDAIVSLRPDLVIANEEENRAPDLEALRAAGLDVLVTEIRTLDQALSELTRVLEACGVLSRPRWLAEAEEAWAAVDAGALPGLRPGAASGGTGGVAGAGGGPMGGGPVGGGPMGGAVAGAAGG
ncbi:helical backbone metal receptor, partial [Streptomyces sp. TRM64462]|uniref:helical backbone metal receptor n=1 Tax=Streptomyces sp. TRM64462 TaxID=2741726 RepID=UPI002815F2EC